MNQTEADVVYLMAAGLVSDIWAFGTAYVDISMKLWALLRRLVGIREVAPVTYRHIELTNRNLARPVVQIESLAPDDVITRGDVAWLREMGNHSRKEGWCEDDVDMYSSIADRIESFLAPDEVIAKGWLLKGPDWDQGEPVVLSGWQGWRVHANQGPHMEAVRIVRGHG